MWRSCSKSRQKGPIWCAVLAALAAGGPRPGAQATSSALDVRLLTAVDSSAAEPVAVRAITITSPLSVAAVLPAGCELTGTAVGDREVSRRRQRAALRITLSSLRDQRGQSQPVRLRVRDVDNARETVTDDGVILGLESLRAVPSRRETLLLLAAHAHPFLLATTEGVRLVRREVAHPHVAFAAGTELSLAVQDVPAQPLTCGSPAPPLRAADPELQARVAQWPRRTQTPSARDADWINVAFTGTREAVAQAFERAGWLTADRTGLRSDVRTFLALAAHHGYQAGPVSRLLLNGADPAMVFQKQNDTFAKRHHIRIWAHQAASGEDPAWIAAATHDVGIEFSRESRHFTHRIAGTIDDERAKVVGDLAAAGAVDAVTLVRRSTVPVESRNAAGDTVTTDGRVAVVTVRIGG